ncbi:MAG: FHA domain-containing protein [Chloroflexota bacterium]
MSNPESRSEDDQFLPDLDEDTLETPNVEPPTDKMDQVDAFPADMPTLNSGDILLYISGQPQPLRLAGARRIVIGRGVAQLEGANQFVDLSEADAELLGVSRRHAIIIKTSIGFMLEDMVSTNGTLLNSVRINALQKHPIGSGDVITLGRLSITVYVADSLTTSSVRLRVTRLQTGQDIQDEVETEGMRITEFSEEVVPVLSAIANLHRHLSANKNELTFNSINVMNERTSGDGVVVYLSTLDSDIHEILRHILTMRMIYDAEIVKLRQQDGQLTRLVDLPRLIENNAVPSIVSEIIDKALTRLTKALGIENIETVRTSIAMLVMSLYSVSDE